MTAAWGMLDSGAAIVDVGGESTRPGSGGVTAEEELERIEQVLLDLGGAPVSVDTSKAVVARRALELGVELVNDVTALRGDPELAGVVADAGCYLCLMHMQGEPRTMQIDPTYDDVVSDVKRFLEERLAYAVAAGVREDSSVSTRGSASARQSRTMSSWCAGWASSPRSDGPCSSGSRARARWEAHGRPGRHGRLSRGVGGRRGQRLPPRRVDPACARRARARGGPCRRERGVRMIVELSGLEVFGYHGVEEAEQRLGQLFLFDVRLEVGDRGATDRLGDAVDYTHVASAIRELSDRERFDLLEALATRVADLLMERSRPSRCACACASRRSSRPE